MTVPARGQTPLHVAPTVAIAELLLSHGADIGRDVVLAVLRRRTGA